MIKSSEAISSEVYKGYFIGYNHFSGQYFVKKAVSNRREGEGFICYAMDKGDARRKINQILGQD
jgi:hypothetical protein